MFSASDPYDQLFFDFINHHALTSAKVVVPFVKELIGVDSVVDFGCGCGAWLRCWGEAGVDVLVGIDGAYVDENRLLFDRESFAPHDLSRPIDLERKFSLVQSLEVAEHIDFAYAGVFIENLTRHGDLILFSAALPGQCGIQHVNEQPFAYWRDLFLRQNFALLDPLRPWLVEQDAVAWWYRYGLFLYARKSVLKELDEPLQRHLIADHDKIRDYSPLGVKLQRAVMQWMPRPVVEWFTRYYMRQAKYRTIALRR